MMMMMMSPRWAMLFPTVSDQHETNYVSPASTRFQPDIQLLASSALLFPTPPWQCHPKILANFSQQLCYLFPEISMGCIGLSPSDPSSKSWPAKELGSKSTLDRIDEEAHLHENSVIVTTKPDSRLISKFYSTPDLMKPLPIPGSRTSHISSLKR
jgi:hypothetical protein